MKSKFVKLLFVFWAVIPIFGFTVKMEKVEPLSNFTIVIENTDGGVSMHSPSGSHWRDLSFTLREHQVQPINERGMLELKQRNQQKYLKKSEYLFTVSKAANQIMLKGLKGTAWKDLAFSLKKNQKITFNQNGMVE